MWDTDDSLLRTNFKKIPREDLAEVLIQALIWKEGAYFMHIFLLLTHLLTYSLKLLGGR